MHISVLHCLFNLGSIPNHTHTPFIYSRGSRQVHTNLQIRIHRINLFSLNHFILSFICFLLFFLLFSYFRCSSVLFFFLFFFLIFLNFVLSSQTFSKLHFKLRTEWVIYYQVITLCFAYWDLADYSLEHCINTNFQILIYLQPVILNLQFYWNYW